MKYPVTYIGQVLRMMRALLVSYVVTATFSADYGRVRCIVQVWTERTGRVRICGHRDLIAFLLWVGYLQEG